MNMRLKIGGSPHAVLEDFERLREQGIPVATFMPSLEHCNRYYGSRREIDYFRRAVNHGMKIGVEFEILVRERDYAMVKLIASHVQ